MAIDYDGNVGINNRTPLSMLHLGNCTVINSAPVIVFGKNVNNTGFRNAFMGYSDIFYFLIGDYGNTNITGSLQCSGNLQTGYTVAIEGTSESDVATSYFATPLK